MKRKKSKALSCERSKTLWPIKILFLTIVMSFSISALSESVITGSTVTVSIAILIPLLVVAIVADLIGVAVAASDEEKLIKMSKNEGRGVVVGVKLIKNADKISSLCNDVIGDVCGIVSGAVGSNLATIMICGCNLSAVNILVASLVSSLVAGMTVFGKAVAKKYAIRDCEKITLFLGKILCWFSKNIGKTN